MLMVVGFMNTMDGLYYNPKGAASKRDRKLPAAGDCDLIRQKFPD